MRPYYQDDLVTLYHGDCRDVLAQVPPQSKTACLTDPSYGLTQTRDYRRASPSVAQRTKGFMGHTWDAQVPDVATWQTILQALTPGAHLLAFGAPRTHHRLMVALEDAGFELRDCLMWLQSQGFPKSHSLRALGKAWEGYGTALKPAWEAIVLARTPLSEQTVAANVRRWGTGALCIDGGRIPGVKGVPASVSTTGRGRHGWEPTAGGMARWVVQNGRFPSNLLLDEPAAALLDAQSGYSRSSRSARGERHGRIYGGGKGPSGSNTVRGHTDSGGASRFFYCSKASPSERGPDTTHPCVKPLALLTYLLRLLALPEGTLVLDPFAGSGSTLLAARALGLPAIGIEAHRDYCAMAARRLRAPRQEAS